MNYQIRPFQNEFAAVAPLISLNRAEPVTPERLEEVHGNFPQAGIRRRLVVEDAAGAIIGYANAEWYPWERPGRFYTAAIVAPGARNRGIGSALVEANERFAREHGAVELIESVKDNDETALAFGRNRGYAVDRHFFESALDLTAFDAVRFHGAIEATKASGIRFLRMAEAMSDESKRRLADMYYASVMDVPGIAWIVQPPYEEFHRWLFESSVVDPAHVTVAADGANYVGVTVLERRSTGGMYTSYTGVAQGYRGRGIALALKVLAAEVAQRSGAPYMRTHNASTNQPMLAVNRRLGYQPAPGNYDLIKRF